MFRTFAVAFLVLLAAIAVACADDDTDGDVTPTAPAATATAPGETPTQPPATSTPADTDGGDEESFRAFLPELDAAVQRGDVSFFENRLNTMHIVCSEEDVAGGIGAPACDFVGQEYDGVSVGRWRSEGGVVPADAVLAQLGEIFGDAMPAESDEFGDSTPRIYAYDITGDRFTAIMTAIVPRPESFAGSGPLRMSVGLDWVFVDGEWQLDFVLYAYVLAEELLTGDNPDLIYPNWQRFEP